MIHQPNVMRCGRCELPIYIWTPTPYHLPSGWAVRADWEMAWCPSHAKAKS